ncbi:MAG: hypothetical protein KC800_10160 [Candidatus Eremiobacteraeota bacterium]|nr:hypothetical protein [Candidatus Eremiobacteraeota bacterium]
MRSLVAIIFLLAVMLVTSGTAASALEVDAPAPASAATTISEDFCGKLPPATISCPQTGLNQCQCYLAPDHDTAGPPAVEAPRRRSIAPKPKKRRVLAVLPDFQYAQPISTTLRSSLERPPQ